jgi:4-hydroxybenzoate polyprenyltransferase
VLPDLEEDRATGVRGLPHRLGHARATGLALAALAAASAVVVLGPAAPPSGSAVLGGAVALALAGVAAAVALARPRSDWPFRLSMVVAAVCVVLLVMAGPELITVRSTVAP